MDLLRVSRAAVVHTLNHVAPDCPNTIRDFADLEPNPPEVESLPRPPLHPIEQSWGSAPFAALTSAPPQAIQLRCSAATTHRDFGKFGGIQWVRPEEQILLKQNEQKNPTTSIF